MLAVMLAAMLTAPPPGAAGEISTLFDEYKCSITGTTVFENIELTLVDQFETTGAIAIRPVIICNPVSKNGGPINNPFLHYVCSQTINARGTPAFEQRTVTVVNQFGEHSFLVRNRHNTVCVPSLKFEDGDNGTAE